MWGNYDTSVAANLVITFDRCNNATSSVLCKSEEEITDWLRFKYIFFAYNNKRFISNEFGEARISKLMQTRWFPIAPDLRIDYVGKIIRT